MMTSSKAGVMVGMALFLGSGISAPGQVIHAPAHAPRSEPVEDPYAGNPYKEPVSPTYLRIGRYFQGSYKAILFRMGNQYSGPVDPNFGHPYIGFGYVANIHDAPLCRSLYYSPYYNNTTGTYYGPSSWLQQSLVILHEPPPDFPPAFQGH